MLTRGKFASLMAPGLAKIFFASVDKVVKEHERWINIRTSKRQYEEDYKLAGVGPFRRKREGAVYTFDELLPGTTVRYTHSTFGLGIRIAREMQEDELYGVVNRLTQELGKAAAHNKEVRAHNVLNQGFVTTTYTGFTSGEALFATSHTNLDGSTQANRPSTDADLSWATLKAAVEQFDQWTDDRGLPDPKKPAILLVSPTFAILANELLKTMTRPVIDVSAAATTESDRIVNVISTQYGITPVTSHYTTDADAFYVLAAKGEHDINMFIRKDDSFNDADDPLTDDAIFTARHRISEGFGDWRGAYASTGA
jgi:hypothetical protein